MAQGFTMAYKLVVEEELVAQTQAKYTEDKKKTSLKEGKSVYKIGAATKKVWANQLALLEYIVKRENRTGKDLMSLCDDKLPEQLAMSLEQFRLCKRALKAMGILELIYRQNQLGRKKEDGTKVKTSIWRVNKSYIKSVYYTPRKSNYARYMDDEWCKNKYGEEFLPDMWKIRELAAENYDKAKGAPEVEESNLGKLKYQVFLRTMNNYIVNNRERLGPLFQE